MKSYIDLQGGYALILKKTINTELENREYLFCSTYLTFRTSGLTASNHCAIMSAIRCVELVSIVTDDKTSKII